jgi:uncharacterized membrane protein YvlD (DUF360 family)
VTLAVVAIVLGLFNSFLRPFLLAVFMIVSIPILILTLGLGAYLVLFLTNGAILALTDSLIKDFDVRNWAMATLTISITSWMISSSVGIDQAQAAAPGQRSQGQRPEGQGRRHRHLIRGANQMKAESLG